jgi:hypothetical protein
MESTKLAILLSFGVLFVLAAVCFSRLFEHQISEILGTFFALLLRPFWLINDSLQRFWRGVGEFYRGQFLVNGQLDLQHVFYQFIDSLLYSIFSIGFLYSEFHLLVLSLAAIGIETWHFNSPIGAGTLTAFALISSFLFWGSIILDLWGITNTGPWRDGLNEKRRKQLFVTTLSCLALSLFVAGSMGLFRGKVIADESLNPQSYVFSYEGGLSDSSSGFSQSYHTPSNQTSNETASGLYYWIPIIANVFIPILVGIGGVFAGWGIVIFLKFLLLLMGFLILCPLGIALLASILFASITDRFYQFVDAIFRLFSAMGGRLMEFFGWNPTESKQPEEPNGNECSEIAEDNMRDQSEDQEPPGESQEDDQPAPPEDGWDPFKDKEESTHV